MLYVEDKHGCQCDGGDCDYQHGHFLLFLGLLVEDQTANVYWTCSTKADAWIVRS